MTIADLAHYRLINQQVTEKKCTSVKELVGCLGAIQAQDYYMAKWAIGVRLKKSTDALIEQAIDNAEIIRTHVLRPTWHFVAATDIRWMLELTAPHVRTILNSNGNRLGLTEKVYGKSHDIIIKELIGGKQLTREELMAELKKNKIATNDLRALHIMMRAELDGIVCNGSRRGKQFTYALMDERVPKAKRMDREEALTKLATRYFTSHGPATVYDFAWWSGLKMVDAKLAIELIRKSFDSRIINDKTYWFNDLGIKKKKTEGVHFLPAFDEYIISYKDRTTVMEPEMLKSAILKNAIFKPILVINGKVEGIWTRSIKKDRVEVDLNFFKFANKVNKQVLEDAIESYGHFMGSEIQLKIGKVI
ncbi:MAG TPA: winged helix DNA-binding domain-containing protein [Bacteroidia bacterium]|jgi:hypothetical protein|nr:winged helix DNA-binding domain-containing protein [Bacteroidia bacterium]